MTRSPSQFGVRISILGGEDIDIIKVQSRIEELRFCLVQK